ncbi:helix-turn-helix transcriptional regulator [Amycolatopsis alkalitolerans]|nr:helix-turn-helix transcriptional regulator [Amycolatopsis alkalitolerans]
MLEQILSPAATALYRRLTTDHYHVVDDADTLEETQRELVDSGFARVEEWNGLVRLVPVAPATAAQMVLRTLTDTIGKWQQETARAVDELIRLEPQHSAASDDSRTPLAEVITDPARIPALVHDLQASARDELLSLEVPIAAGVICRPSLSPAAANPPARWRTVFTTGYLTAEYQHIPETIVRRGGEVRLRRTLPTKLLISDRTFALVPLDQPGVAGVVLFRSATVITTLTVLFDALWEQSTPHPSGTSGGESLTPFEHHVLSLLASGLKDEEIAEHTHVSLRTVRRHVASILHKLAVDTRFAAGVQAAKRGWA